ncbi:MAG: TRAP transporter small permease [Pseudomonadota bacterium]
MNEPGDIAAGAGAPGVKSGAMAGAERLAALAARWSARLGGAVILFAAILVTAEVANRNLEPWLGLGIKLHAFELTNYAFASAVAFGFAYALTERSHIRIDLLYARLPVGLRAGLDAAALLALAVLGTGMAWQGWRVVLRSAELGARPNATLDLPLAIPQALWAVGLSWFAAVALLLAVLALVDLVTGQVNRLNTRAGIPSVAEEAKS